MVLILVVIVGSWVGFSFAIVLISASLPINIFYAFILAYIVSIVSAFLEFIIVRKIARRYVEENFTSKIKKIEDYNQIFNAKGFILIFMIRLVMLIPFELVNLFGALSRVKFKDYILGTMIGIIPSIIITIYFLRNAESVWSPNFIISLIVLIIFVSIPLLSKKVRKIVFK
ncbi:MAG TPA: VTT domain-containing protein [Candidatus Nanoarchaeia archaeon]|nr:VTT domain-containing protein [Candidatus Nanoarchaeia archaeon]